MFTISISNASSDNFYADLTAAAKALVDGEPDDIANMANIAALIWQYLPDLNWAGFYRRINDELVLGPFQGQTACIRIAVGKGVCGTAAATGKSQRIADINAFEGHIACDPLSRSELVIPVLHDNHVIAVLDLDSPKSDRFTSDDQAGLEKLIGAISHALG